MSFGTPVTELLKESGFKKFHLINLGAPGAGKTTRSLSATQYGPVLVIDFDGKIQGALRQIPNTLAPVIDLTKISVQRAAKKVKDASGKEIEIPWACKDIEDHAQSLVAAFKGKQIPFATLVIDTFTKLNQFYYDDEFPDEKSISASNKWDRYSRIKFRLTELFKTYQSLPCNLIVNCHTELNEHGIPTGVRGQGGFKGDINIYMTDMHYVALELGKNVVKVRNSSTPPVNTNIDPKYIDPKGYATKFDLGIFEDYAFKV